MVSEEGDGLLKPKLNFPKPVRIVLIIVAIVLGILVIARLIGPEDYWYKNEQGKWMKHGQPSAPKPKD